MAEPVTCETCGRTCKSKMVLRQHMRAHIRKHLCPEERCSQKDPSVAFGTKRDLERHRRTHGRGANRIKCPYCNGEVERLDNLSRHIASLHEDQLCVAAAQGDVAAVSMLLDAGADTNVEDESRRTAFGWVAGNKDEGMAKLLLDHTSTEGLLNAGSILESTALEFAHTAVKMGNISIVKLMLSHAKNVGMPWSLGLLLTTRSCPSEAVLRLLLNHYGVKKDDFALLAQPLYFAALEGNEAVIRLLLECGAETEHRRGLCMQTPLITAWANNHTEAMKALLEGGADPRKLPGWRWRPE